MAYFVFHGYSLRCSMGDMESKLQVIEPMRKGLMGGKNAGNIKDCKPVTNIESFGRCRSMLYPPTASATAANFGVLQPMPCTVPNIVGDKWEGGTLTGVYIRGEPALVSDAKLMCVFNGIIEIHEEDMEAMDIGGDGLDIVDLEYVFGKDYERGPGTRYINDKGELLYRRNDGLSDRILIVLDKDIPLLEQRLRKAKMVGSLNDPNEYISVGMTGTQYTNQKLCISPSTGLPYKVDHYTQGYRDGYRKNPKSSVAKDATLGIIDQLKYTMLELVTGEKSAPTPDIVGDMAMQRYDIGKDDGENDWENGRIDRLNPTSHIEGGPLLDI